MTKLGTQQDFWNKYAEVKGNYGSPLNLSPEEVAFQQKYTVTSGKTLVLGATTALCAMARDISASVVAVDYAADIIAALRMPGVRYECMDWFTFFAQNTEQFDNIMTDGGLICLEFPKSWQQIAEKIYMHLLPGGIFTAKIYISTSTPPPQNSTNPKFNRFMNIQALEKDNWMIRPTYKDYVSYDVRYALPPEQKILQIFDKFSLKDKYVPDYEEGSRFVSFAWRRP